MKHKVLGSRDLAYNCKTNCRSFHFFLFIHSIQSQSGAFSLGNLERLVFFLTSLSSYSSLQSSASISLFVVQQTMSSSSSSSVPERTIILQSDDGQNFVIDEEVGMQSEVIKAWIAGHNDDQSILVKVPHVKGNNLQKVIQYLTAHAQNANNDFKVWDRTFVRHRRDHILFDFALAADFLGVQDLLDVTTKRIQYKIKGMTPEQVKLYFTRN